MTLPRAALRLAITGCTSCALHKAATPVPWSGPAPSDVAILGEAPGRTEEAQGAPFVGPAGKLARRWLVSAGLKPDGLAFLNVVCCWPHGTPDPDHIKACQENLQCQLDFIQPKYILAFGNIAKDALLTTTFTMGQVHGRWFQAKGAWCMATYHPAAILRGQNPDMDADAQRDILHFAQSVLLGDLFPPMKTNRCVKCERWGTSEYQGIFVCAHHHPPRRKKQKGYEQLALLDQLPDPSPTRRFMA